MVEQFKFFRANRSAFASTEDRCRLIDWTDFDQMRNWLVDRSWTHEEKVALDIAEETFEVDPEEFRDLVRDARAALDALMEDLS
jgi:hypothetical protein